MKLTLQTTKLKIYATPVIKTGNICISKAHVIVFWVDTLCFILICWPGTKLFSPLPLWLTMIYLLPPYISTWVCIYWSIHLQYIEDRAGQSDQITALPRRIVTLATVYSPYLYNEMMMMIGEMRPHECDRGKYKPYDGYWMKRGRLILLL